MNSLPSCWCAKESTFRFHRTVRPKLRRSGSGKHTTAPPHTSLGPIQKGTSHEVCPRLCPGKIVDGHQSIMLSLKTTPRPSLHHREQKSKGIFRPKIVTMLQFLLGSVHFHKETFLNGPKFNESHMRVN